MACWQTNIVYNKQADISAIRALITIRGGFYADLIKPVIVYGCHVSAAFVLFIPTVSRNAIQSLG